ncbi:hypothetical protein CAC42_5975 [Sphaceloma murrayae]|uniref:RING-type domain-containing protein n=1 Tax=Sphaceloma murrayae TaxID=2082308 RepID=A0A2K1QZQ4_9PEZI|nr:hypothetical protein CAC42_5975 [Sphaceloma murrayae]
MPSIKRRADNMDDSATRKRQQLRHTATESGSVNEDTARSDVTVKPDVSVVAETTVTTATADNESAKTLRLLHSDFDVLRQTLTCRICEKLFYEPYVLHCGHTYCYRCLSTWFSSYRNMSCPDCRVRIKQTPAPSYAIKDMVTVFMKRAELLPDGETIEEHEIWRKEEEDHVAADRNNQDPRHGGLFKGKFNRRGVLRPLVDPSDGVARCPRCNWEIEDDTCEHCGIHFDSEGYESASDDYDSYMEDELDGDLDAVDHLPWYDGQDGHGSGSIVSDSGETYSDVEIAPTLRHRHANRLVHNLAHHQAHQNALMANGQPLQHWADVPRGWPTQGGLDDDDEDEDEGEEDEDDGEDLSGFVVADDSVEDGAASPVTISSEEDEPPRRSVPGTRGTFSWRRRGGHHTHAPASAIRRIPVSSDDDSEGSDDDSNEDTNDIMPQGSSETHDSESDSEAVAEAYARRAAVLNELSLPEESSASESDQSGPVVATAVRRMNFAQRRRQPQFQRAGRAPARRGPHGADAATVAVDEDSGYRQMH